MTDQERNAMEMALKLLENNRLRTDEHLIPIVVDALRQALARTPDDLLRQSEQEGWRWAKECEAEVKRLKQEKHDLAGALKEIAEWTERYTSAGHPISTVARAALAKHKEQA